MGRISFISQRIGRPQPLKWTAPFRSLFRAPEALEEPQATRQATPAAAPAPWSKPTRSTSKPVRCWLLTRRLASP